MKDKDGTGAFVTAPFIKINMKEGDLRIFYNLAEGINVEFDNDLARLCKKHGFHRWASGISLRENIRDIALERKEVEVPSGEQAPPVKVHYDVNMSAGDKKSLVEFIIKYPFETLFTAIGDLDKRLKSIEEAIKGPHPDLKVGEICETNGGIMQAVKIEEEED